jgi:hypothetical protein
MEIISTISGIIEEEYSTLAKKISQALILSFAIIPAAMKPLTFHACGADASRP